MSWRETSIGVELAPLMENTLSYGNDGEANNEVLSCRSTVAAAIAEEYAAALVAAGTIEIQGGRAPTYQIMVKVWFRFRFRLRFFRGYPLMDRFGLYSVTLSGPPLRSRTYVPDYA